MKRSIKMINTHSRYFVGMVLIFGMISMAVLTALASEKYGINCDIQQGPCITETIDGTKIELEILPRPTAMSDLVFIITLSKNGKPVSDASVLLDLTMPGMFMGKNQLTLKQVKNGRYEAHGTLTRCMSGRKTWRANVTAGNAGKIVSADFIFEVK